MARLSSAHTHAQHEILTAKQQKCLLVRAGVAIEAYHHDRHDRRAAPLPALNNIPEEVPVVRRNDEYHTRTPTSRRRHVQACMRRALQRSHALSLSTRPSPRAQFRPIQVVAGLWQIGAPDPLHRSTPSRTRHVVVLQRPVAKHQRRLRQLRLPLLRSSNFDASNSPDARANLDSVVLSAIQIV